MFSSTWGGRRTTIFWIKGTWRFQDFGAHCFRYSLEPIRSDQGSVLNRVRQKLWESGIRPDRPRYNSHYLEVDLIIHSKGTNFSVDVSLKKMAQAYGYDPRKVGTVIELPQGKYGVFGNAHRDKGYVLDAVEEVLEEFIADYKESNLF